MGLQARTVKISKAYIIVLCCHNVCMFIEIVKFIIVVYLFLLAKINNYSDTSKQKSKKYFEKNMKKVAEIFG